jgi:hypothetical protein
VIPISHFLWKLDPNLFSLPSLSQFDQGSEPSCREKDPKSHPLPKDLVLGPIPNVYTTWCVSSPSSKDRSLPFTPGPLNCQVSVLSSRDQSPPLFPCAHISPDVSLLFKGNRSPPLSLGLYTAWCRSHHLRTGQRPYRQPFPKCRA